MMKSPESGGLRNGPLPAGVTIVHDPVREELAKSLLAIGRTAADLEKQLPPPEFERWLTREWAGWEPEIRTCLNIVQSGETHPLRVVDAFFAGVKRHRDVEPEASTGSDDTK